MGWKRWRRPIGEDLAREWHGGSEDGGGGPRILFESPDGAEAHAVSRVLGRHGCRTMWCTGPEGASPCVLVATGTCRLVDEADLVVSSLDLGDRRCQDVARALDRRTVETPVVVMTRKDSAEEWRAELPTCQVTSDPLSSKALLDAVGALCPGSVRFDAPSAEGRVPIGFGGSVNSRFP